MQHTSSSSKILGIGGSSHDFSAALLINGQLALAIEEERLDRVRHGSQAWHNMPGSRSAGYCLQSSNLLPEELDAIYVNQDLESTTPLFKGLRVSFVPHHLAHAAATFFTSPYDCAGLLVIDGHGGAVSTASEEVMELETISLGLGKGELLNLQSFQTGVKRLSSGSWHYLTSNSLGTFYKVVTDVIGFGMRGQGKTMGLAPYGDGETLYTKLLSFASLNMDGQFIFDPYSGIYDWLTKKLVNAKNPFKIRADIAAATQRIFEEVVTSLATECFRRTGQRVLCYGGGCALNGSANYRILHDTPIEQLFIFPAAGDSGLAVGAAYVGYFRDFGGRRCLAPSLGIGITAYTGKNYTLEECEKALNLFPLFYYRPKNLISEIAQRLLQHEVIAVFRGRSEFGPRALGNRSIIADPRTTMLRDYININIKGRESFRPLAPMVPIEYASKYFALDHSSPFMLLIAKVRDLYREALAGICHIDGTARVQTVDRQTNPFIHQLLCEYGKISGVPVLINTSFNGRGEPIVERPEDALKCYLGTPLNTLVLEEFLVEKHTPWANRPLLTGPAVH